MQIRLNKGVADIKLTKPELKKLSDVSQFLSAIPKGLPFEDEREAAEKALQAFVDAVTPSEDAPPY